MKFPAQKANEAMFALVEKAAIPEAIVTELINSVELDVIGILEAAKSWNFSSEKAHLICDLFFDGDKSYLGKLVKTGVYH